MKINRQQVYDKYNGRCAYCGEKITIKQMQVDHIIPKRAYENGLDWVKNNYKIGVVPEMDSFENLNPSCAPCNIFKQGWMTIEDMRSELSKQAGRIKSSQFDRALRYGQVMITPKPIVFYFEKV